MSRYTLTAEDRRKGGQTTSQRYDMRERGRKGFQALANKYFEGDTQRAGDVLSRIGNWRTDPARWNLAFKFPIDCPNALRERVLGQWNASDDGVPF